ncbi:YdeI/OmpD-associated family protein [Halomonas sp. LR3S48]|uniref:YdeI/OmpD-associated family protein n=1 Tax=Halomonas sp. LR3S48 TaxID=2982694 RepID=UPI0021E3FC15|nr:YdeI/OmpD-associated family protein [Halomonas sp. LR3S48]UYG04573.1 YdeI/OmpD-associated family protein [Halomonas sp. LR3S48]
MSLLRFRTTIEINNINPYVLVAAAQATQLRPGWRKPMPVCVRIKGEPDTTCRINMMPVGDGSFYLYLNGEARKASNTKVGDTVSLGIEFDEAYQSGPVNPMPPWFSEALEQNPHAMQAWNDLIPSLKKEFLRYFARLKSPEAQARNAQQALYVLSGNRGRFLARSWHEGRVQEGR